MSPKNELHPPSAELQAFGLGLLSAETARPIEEHVLGCDQCCQALLDVGNDSVLDRLRQVAPPDAEGLAAAALPLRALAAGSQEGLPEALRDHPRYRLLRLLGRGGMGAVYLAEHLVLNRLVALKVLNHDCLVGATAVARFRREARCAASFQHANIVTVYDADQSADTCFLVMEYVEGTSLDRLLEERGRLSIAEACDFIRQAAMGLQHAHERGMVHRDVKPHNLMICPGGTVKILDFGLATLAEEGPPESPIALPSLATLRDERLTRTSATLGTPDYMSPEQAAGLRSADSRSDLYSLGCTLYEVLTGKVPFSAPSLHSKLLAHREAVPPAVRQLRREVPASLAALLDRMLAKSPSERTQTAEEVAKALAPFVEERSSSRHRRRKVLAALGLVVIAGLLAAGRMAVFPTQQKVPLAQEGAPAARPLVFSEVLRLPQQDYIGRLAISPDGRLLLVSALDSSHNRHRAWLWNVESGKLRMALNTYIPLFTHDGKQILGMNNKELHYFDAETGKQLRTFASLPRQTEAWSLNRSPDDRTILTASSDRFIRLWDRDTGTEQGRWFFKADPPMFFSGDGRYFFIRSDPQSQRPWQVWDVEKGREVNAFPNLRNNVALQEIFDSGKEALVSNKQAMHVLSADTGWTLRTIPLDTAAGVHRTYHHVGPHGRCLLTTFSDGCVRLHDLSNGVELARVVLPNTSSRLCVLSADNRTAAAILDREVVVWRIAPE